MWRKLVALMRGDGVAPGRKPNPLQRRPVPDASSVTEIAFAGANPGNLRMFGHVPQGLPPGAPLVVALHGCGQTAAGYDQGAGWSRLADELGFAVLAPEQKAVNNPHTCFDWFNPEDIARGGGEVASIAAMIETMVETHALDPARVFITGLSAGGAMAAAMLAVYPELFAGGAIIAGLPFGAAANVRDALEAMRSAPLRTPRAWADAVRAASDHAGPWPRISIWHGALDTTVNVNNAQALVAQWADLHAFGLTEARQEMVDGAIRLAWGDRLEVYTLPMLGHATPIDSADIGVPGPFIQEAGISSTRRIASFWGLAAKKPRAAPVPSQPVHAVPPPEPAEAPPQGHAAPEELPPVVTAENFVRRVLRKLGY
ncbi:MAG TPA: PHB depolymerase family esterase [Rhizomicrobium sp.]|jgi:poly(hydroxyalkanoate) depolymerase family esterase|nr:PHB depolymerase family esterase [Rhizomicrobium sp.]